MFSLSSKLAFGELEAPSCAGASVLFTLNHAWVAGKVTVTAQTGVIGMIHLAERAGESVAASAGLTVAASAVNIDQYVVFVLVGCNHQRLADYVHMFFQSEISGQILVVDYDFSAAVPDINPSYRCFSSSCTYSKILNHTNPYYASMGTGF